MHQYCNYNVRVCARATILYIKIHINILQTTVLEK
uniref:Uncharacterized protein n=1 Tax=Siphoviridae sp. ctOCb13 TaxID=2825477 RepID=A0A8S5Q058_9CAUD|nr:MAG TPA: hypothetical protein [Siphoviridae sp. ctOCb13]